MPKKNEGYLWMPGGELPLIEPHSVQKHRVYAAYVKSYIEILAQNPRVSNLPITFVDGFAGGGLYHHSVTGEVQLGSPLLLLEAVSEAEISVNLRRQSQSVRTPLKVSPEFHFVDSAKPHLDFLKAELIHRGFENRIGTDIFLHLSKFAQVQENIVTRVQNRGRSGRSLFFLDQYGYKNVPFASIKYILSSLRKSEVVLTFATDHLIAYFSERNRDTYKKIFDKINLGEFIDVDELLRRGQEAPEFRLFVQSQLIEPLRKASGALFFTPFYITCETSNRAYWLIHFSMHPRARDAMLTEHWNHQNTFGHYGRAGLNMLGYATRNDLESGLNAALSYEFDDTARERTHTALMTDIPSRLSSEWISVNEFLREIANETPANASIVLSVLSELAQYHVIESRGQNSESKRRNTAIKPTDSIRLLKQFRLDLNLRK